MPWVRVRVSTGVIFRISPGAMGMKKSMNGLTFTLSSYSNIDPGWC